MEKPTHSSESGWGCQNASLKTGLFRRNTLQLQSISLGYKRSKTRLVLELRETTDQNVRNVNIKVVTGWKWNTQSEVEQAISCLQHQEIVSRVQADRAGLECGEVPQFWSKANRKERKEMVVEEVIRMEKEHYKIKAVSQG